MAKSHVAALVLALAASGALAQQQPAMQWETSALAGSYKENISEDEKIAGLSKLWSEVKYNFVDTATLEKLDWDKLYLDTLPRVRATRSTEDYYRILTEMVGKLKDGHTNVYPPQELSDRMGGMPLLKTMPVEGRVIVTEVLDPGLRAKGIMPGLEVIEVDGVEVRTYAARELAPYVSASTPQDQELAMFGSQFLRGAVGSASRLTFRSAAGKQFDQVVPRVSREARKAAATGTPSFEFSMLPGDVAYVSLNSFDDNSAAEAWMAAFDEIAKSSALVIDVRRNGGGNSDVGYKILATLDDKAFLTSRWATRDYKPTWRAWGKEQPMYAEAPDAVQPDPTHQYKKNVLVLTSAATFSAAEDFAVAFDGMQRGTLVGEATGGSTGQPLFIKLPGGGQARICTKQDTYPDGRPFVGIGVQPQHLVKQTVEGVRAGRDEVLEAALATLQPK
ncbi:S41 family peptidase [Pseudoduganella violaceinigra]|uniref:S41 family peptidase n=1 Tax=Pseudoduganella violaceinigra TaxID=246602 RepID=UPI0003F5CFD3|nr:S41 family peptidase [Pseudoduganella violaceinigra]